jgi:hypothetical protein
MRDQLGYQTKSKSKSIYNWGKNMKLQPTTDGVVGFESGLTLRTPLLIEEEWYPIKVVAEHPTTLLPSPTKITTTTTTTTTTMTDRWKTTPVSGKWKDGLCSCFRYGLFHPHLWNAWLCPQILLGQLLVRMKMTWLVHNPFQRVTTTGSGSKMDRAVDTIEKNVSSSSSSAAKIHPSSSSSSSVRSTTTTTKTSTWSGQSTFRKIICLVVLGCLYDALLAPPFFQLHIDPDTGEMVWWSLPPGSDSGNDGDSTSSEFPMVWWWWWWHQLWYMLFSLPMTIGGVLVVVKLRAAIRQEHDIPTGSLGRYEDLVCVCCCHCCVLSQMARQTADYDDTEPASCCSVSGIRTVNNNKNNNNNVTKWHDYDNDNDDNDVVIGCGCDGDDEDLLVSPLAQRVTSSSPLSSSNGSASILTTAPFSSSNGSSSPATTSSRVTMKCSWRRNETIPNHRSLTVPTVV